MIATPIRIERRGVWRWFQPTREEMRGACLWAEMRARGIVWKSVDHLVGYLVQQIGDQLNTRISADVAGWQGEDDLPVIAIYTQNYTHHIEVQKTTIYDEPGIVEEVLAPLVPAAAPKMTRKVPERSKV